MILIKNGWPVMHGIDAIVLMLSNTMCNRDGYTYIMKKYFQKIYFNNRCHHVVNITNSLSFQFQWIKPSARQYGHENGKLISRCRKHNCSSYISSFLTQRVTATTIKTIVDYYNIWNSLSYYDDCVMSIICRFSFRFQSQNTRLFSRI